MHRCPQCSKPLPDLVRRCPTCQADLDLLVDLAGQMRGGLEKAEAATRAGELGEAVWSYLEVLEADPDNPGARRQIARIATAVRQFDLSTPARRWASGMPAEETFWEKWGKVISAAAAGLMLGLLIGLLVGRSRFPAKTIEPPVENHDDKKGEDGKAKDDGKTKEDGKTKDDPKKLPDGKKIDAKKPADPETLPKKAEDPLKVRPKLGSPLP